MRSWLVVAESEVYGTCADSVELLDELLRGSDRVSKLLEGGRACETGGCQINPTGQPGRSIRCGKQRTAIYEQCWGAPEVGRFGFFLGRDALPQYRNGGMLRGDYRKPFRGRLPVRAPIEVLQRDLHVSTVSQTTVRSDGGPARNVPEVAEVGLGSRERHNCERTGPLATAMMISAPSVTAVTVCSRPPAGRDRGPAGVWKAVDTQRRA